MLDQQINDFLEHHGVKGMKWRIKQEELDRLYRIASGTETRRNKVKEALKVLVKNISKDDVVLPSNKTVEEDESKANKPVPSSDKNNEKSIKDIIERFGATRLIDLGPLD